MQPDSNSLTELAGAKVAFVNWRDPAHPQAGGAEVYCWEIARRLAAYNADVTLISSRPEATAPNERVDGIQIVRRGGTFTVYAHAAAYLASHRRRFDAVVDCQNGIPFFAPLFVPRSTAVICVIHHVHQDQFGVHFGWPLRLVGRQLEGRWSRVVYGHRPLVVVSPSTRVAVRDSLGLRGPIFVVPNGAPPAARPSTDRRSPFPLIASVGRLAAHKRMDLLIRTALALRGRVRGLRVEIAGDGPDRPRLEKLAEDLGVDGVVRFLGRVSPEAKERLLDAAWLTVNPSIGEGWGLGVLEANAQGVPAVAFRVPGLCDSIQDGITGWLADPGSDLSEPVADALTTLSDPDLAHAWAVRCRAWAARFTWEESARRLAGIIVAERARRSSRRSDRRRALNDAAYLVEVTGVPAPRMAKLASGLRRTDLVSVRDGEARMLLHSLGDHDVHMVLDRLELAGKARTATPATGYDLLVGPGPDEGIDLRAGLAASMPEASA
jgi:glycosyltransferase involved in cell wall biosynthesis